jgi:hypothetical protein
MIRYNAPDIRRIAHALKVLSFARAIAHGEGVSGETLAQLEAAACLHDIGIHEAMRKHGSTAGPWQELEGEPLARDILTEQGYSSDTTDRVVFIVGHHHQYRMIDGVDFQILVEADCLVNFEEESMAREEMKAVIGKVFITETGKSLARELFFK